MPPKGSKLGPPPALPDPESPAMVQQNANSSGIAEYELPKTSLTKLAKGSVSVYRAEVLFHAHARMS